MCRVSLPPQVGAALVQASYKRVAVGPLATIAMAAAVWLLDREGFVIPAPGILLLGTVAFATWVGGLRPGYVSAAICVAAGFLLLSERKATAHQTP